MSTLRTVSFHLRESVQNRRESSFSVLHTNSASGGFWAKISGLESGPFFWACTDFGLESGLEAEKKGALDN